MSEKTEAKTDPTAAWKKMAEEQAARVESAFEQATKLEMRAIEQACSAIDEAAKLQKQTLAYAAELTAEWRKMMVAAAKASASTFGGPFA